MTFKKRSEYYLFSSDGTDSSDLDRENDQLQLCQYKNICISLQQRKNAAPILGTDLKNSCVEIPQFFMQTGQLHMSMPDLHE